MRLLPHWILTDITPSFYDTDSGTVIEQTAKVYAAMNELINEYNKFVDDINSLLVEYKTTTNKTVDEFTETITKTVENYIKCIDMKISKQDLKIAQATDYMKNNLYNTISALISDMRNSGELDEAILSALDGVNRQITTIENSMPYYVYKEGTEELELKNIPIRSE